MKLRASIVTYKTPSDELSNVLALLRAAGIEEVDVIDNGQESRIADLCQGRANYIGNSNTGYGAAHNKSLRRSVNADYHLVINSDIEFDPEAISGMLEYMERHKDVAMVHPRILGLDGRDQYTVRMLPTPFDLMLRRFLPSWACQGKRDRYLLKHMDHAREHDVAYVQGSFMLMRVSALMDVGLFDERFFMYSEDVDLTRRLAQRYRVVYYPYAKVVHAHRAASYTSLRMMYIHALNMVRYFNKWGWLHDPQRRAFNRRMAAER